MGADVASRDQLTAKDEYARRILDGETFRRTGRLRNLLAFLLARSSSSPDSPIREYDIGTEVYGRPAGYDTSHDTIVRVQIAQLRKKLERYYETEGAQDELILTIPRGRYHPAWQPKAVEVTAAPVLAAAAAATPRISWSRREKTLLACSAGLLVLLIAVSAGWRLSLRAQNPVLQNSPTVARMWSQILGRGQTTQIVLSDPGIFMLGTVTGQPIRFSELGDRLFLSRIESLKVDSAYQAFVKGATSSQLTHLSDLELVRRITSLGLSDASEMNIVSARDFRIRDLNSHNSVLIGYRRSNPWVEVFQQANFVMDADPQSGRMSIRNLHPERGEQDVYLLGDAKKENPAQGYATVALFPNPAASGKVLIISGADVPGTEAAIRFLMSEPLWSGLYQRIARGGELPSFELLLGYRKLSNSSGDVSPIAWRVH